MAIQKLIVLHTNDLHSFFEQMPKVATVMKQLRQHHEPEEVLMIDCGDHMDRMRLETEGSDGLANIKVMNKTGYEAVILGNNEGLTFLPSVLSNIYSEYADFTVLGSNLYDATQDKVPDWMAPYYIIQKNQLRIAIIGVTINYTKFYNLLGWDVRDPFEVTRALVDALRDSVDIIIVMSHLGINNDRRMAEDIEGIDCIFGAHTHHLLEEPLRIGNTLICAAGKFGQYVGELVLHYDLDKKSIVYADGRCVDVSTFAGDPEVEQIIAHYKEQSEHRLEQVIAVLERPLNIDWSGESPLGSLLAEGIRKWTGAEIGLVNSGQLLQGLNAGEITAKKLLEICPSPINPCTMMLKGKYIRRALEESLLEEYRALPIRGFGFRGQILGSICLDGLIVTYNQALEPYEKITDIRVNGLPLDEEEEYLVGTIDMFTFGIGYTSLMKGKDSVFFLPEFIRDVLHKQLTESDKLIHSRTARWIAQ